MPRQNADNVVSDVFRFYHDDFRQKQSTPSTSEQVVFLDWQDEFLSYISKRALVKHVFEVLLLEISWQKKMFKRENSCDGDKLNR